MGILNFVISHETDALTAFILLKNKEDSWSKVVPTSPLILYW